MNVHEQMQERISMLLDGALSPEEETALRAHLAECPDCAAFYEAFSTLSSFVGGDLEEPPESLRANVMAKLRRDEIRRRSARGPARGWIGLAAIAAVLALVILVGPALRRSDLAANEAASYQASAGLVGKSFGVSGAGETGGAVSFDAAVPYAAAEEEPAEFEYAGEAAPAVPAEPVVVTTEDAAAAEAGIAPARQRNEAASHVYADMEEEAEPISMNELLLRLEGQSTELDLDALGLSPVYLIETDGGVLALYRYGGGLYFKDPFSGSVREAMCGEASLIAFLQR